MPRRHASERLVMDRLGRRYNREPEPEYDFTNAVRAKYLRRYRQGTRSPQAIREGRREGIPLVRLLNYYLSAVLLYALLIIWYVKEVWKP